MRIQTDNGLFDIVFMATGAVLAVLLLRGLFLFATRKPFKVTAGLFWGVTVTYGAGLIISNLMTPWQDLTPGTAKCSDEWCVTVDSVSTTPIPGYAPKGHLVVASVRVFSEARGRTQRGSSPAIYLIDAKGVRHAPSPQAQAALADAFGPQPPLNTQIAPGEAVVTLQAFDTAGTSPTARILIEEEPGITRLILFNEAGYFSGKSVFVVPMH